jgi:hypothetical protein
MVGRLFVYMRVDQIVLPIAFVQDRFGLLAAFLSMAPLLVATYTVLALALTSSQAEEKERKKAD